MLKTLPKTLCAIGFLVGASLITSAALAQISAREIKIGIGVDEKHPKGLTVSRFAELLKQRSNGKIVVTLYANGKLGDDAKAIADMQRGSLDMSVPDTATLVGLKKGFSIINIPFVFTSEDEADALLDGPFGDKLNTSLEEVGLVGLGYWENGFRNVTNSAHEISRVKDFRNLRIRVIGSPMYIDTFSALGATPVPLAFTSVFSALQEKKIDGQENTLATIQSAKFNSVQKYLTLTRHSYSVGAFLMSKQLWDKLSKEERILIKSAALESRDYLRKSIRASNNSALDDLRKAGMVVSELGGVQRSELRTLTRPIFDKYKNEAGKEWGDAMYMSMMRSELEKFNKQ